jgi:uncharacterized membrane protein
MKSLVFVSVLCVGATSAWGQEIVALPANFSPTCISGDGLVVGGSLAQNGPKPALWTREGGIEILVRAGRPNTNGRVWALNYDGSVAAGLAAGATQNPMRWTRAEGMVLFENITGGATSGYGVSDDGRVIVGSGFLGSRGGFVWTPEAGLRNLPNGVDGQATSVSGDGRFFGGSFGLTTIWRWSLELFSGSQISVDEPVSGWSKAMNETGDVMVGRFTTDRTRGFLWTTQGFRILPEITYLNDVSDDGRVAVGRLSGGGAAYYTEGLGSVRLADFLHDSFQMDLTNWNLSEALGISNDGRTIMGTGSPSNWIVYLPASRPGDFNGDETKTIDDLVSFVDCFVGDAVLPPTSADVNHDNFTDWVDFEEFLADF